MAEFAIDINADDTLLCILEAADATAENAELIVCCIDFAALTADTETDVNAEAAAGTMDDIDLIIVTAIVLNNGDIALAAFTPAILTAVKVDSALDFIVAKVGGNDDPI